jgi:hypothetical protein
LRPENVEGLQKVEGQLTLPFSSSGFSKPLRSRSRRMSHLIGDVAEGVWKNSLLSKVIRLETGEDLLVFD